MVVGEIPKLFAAVAVDSKVALNATLHQFSGNSLGCITGPLVSSVIQGNIIFVKL